MSLWGSLVIHFHCKLKGSSQFALEKRFKFIEAVMKKYHSERVDRRFSVLKQWKICKSCISKRGHILKLVLLYHILDRFKCI